MQAMIRPSSTAHSSTPPEYTVQSYPHPLSLPADACALFTAAEAISPEISVAWFANLVDTVYPADSGIRLYVLRENGQPIATLAVRHVRERWKTRVESLSNYYTAFYAPILHPDITEHALSVLLRFICRDGSTAASFRFAPMDPASAGFTKLMAAFSLAGLSPFRYFSFGNWFLKVDQDWVAYLKGRSGTLRNTIKRLGKRLVNDGGSLELVRAGPRLDQAIHAYQQVYAASWKGAEPYPEFVPGLARLAAQRGWLRLGVARLGETPIAAQLWMVCNGRAEIYKVAYHQDYQAYAPGTLLTAMLMEHVIDHDKVFEVDYLIGDDAYKKTWMSDRRERWGIVAYNRHNLTGLVGWVRESLGRAYRRVRPRVEAASNTAK